MPIFNRRQLQMMLDGVSPWLTQAKAVDLVKRIESVDPNQALPAEYELALSWGVAQVSHLEVERPAGVKVPDIFSRNLLESGPLVAEVTAFSDEALSGEAVMKRAANIIINFCNSIVRGSGGHLYFQFLEESGYRPIGSGARRRSAYYRQRRVTWEFTLDDELRTSLTNWLRAESQDQPLHLSNDAIEVIITWRDRVHPHGNTFSSMPSLAHDLKDNPLYTVLKDKERRQLKHIPSGMTRAIFFGDAGCALLRKLKPVVSGIHTVSGHQIIQAFLSKSSVDLICVFVPRRSAADIYRRSWRHENETVSAGSAGIFSRPA